MMQSVSSRETRFLVTPTVRDPLTVTKRDVATYLDRGHKKLGIALPFEEALLNTEKHLRYVENYFGYGEALQENPQDFKTARVPNFLKRKDG